MPSKLNLVEESDGVVFAIQRAYLVLVWAKLLSIVCSTKDQHFHVYYYMIGGIDVAVPHLSLEELPTATKYVVEKVLI